MHQQYHSASLKTKRRNNGVLRIFNLLTLNQFFFDMQMVRFNLSFQLTSTSVPADCLKLTDLEKKNSKVLFWTCVFSYLTSQWFFPANTRKVNTSNGMKKASYACRCFISFFFYQNEYGCFSRDLKKADNNNILVERKFQGLFHGTCSE